MSHPTLKAFRRAIPTPLWGALWVLGTGLVDWLTGPEIATSTFYLPGIIFVAWCSGRIPSLCIAALAGLTWLAAELVMDTHYVHPFIPYWNGLTRLTIFVVTALLTSEVRIRKQAESALHDQKEILSSILDSMDDGVVVVSREGKIITCNPAAHRLVGDAAEGLDAGEWVSQIEKSQEGYPRNIHGKKHPLRLAVEGKIVDYDEISIQRSKENESTRLSLTVLPLLGRDTKRGGVVLVFHDLTVQRNLEKQISEASEREQRRIGQDLHDGICQHFVGVAFAAGTLQSELEAMNLPTQADGAAEIALLVRDGIQQTKNLARGLYPVGIEEGLKVALESLATISRERSGIRCHFSHSCDEFPLDTASAGHLYRVAQEAVSNAIHHAKPSLIRIHMARQEDLLILRVTDDGKGLGSSQNAKRGIGMQIMRYRAHMIGATLEVTSRDGEGTEVESTLPLHIK